MQKFNTCSFIYLKERDLNITFSEKVNKFRDAFVFGKPFMASVRCPNTYDNETIYVPSWIVINGFHQEDSLLAIKMNSDEDLITFDNKPIYIKSLIKEKNYYLFTTRNANFRDYKDMVNCGISINFAEALIDNLMSKGEI